MLTTVLADPPAQPWLNLPQDVKNVAELMIRWAMFLGVAVAVLSVIIVCAMMALDKNRGEAGIAMTDTARWTKIALGIAFVCAAPQIITWFISALPG